MNFHGIPMLESTIKARAHRHDHSHTGHAHFWQRTMSRRQALQWWRHAGLVVMEASAGQGARVE